MGLINKTSNIFLTIDLLKDDQYAIILEAGSITWTLFSFLGLVSNIINIRTFISMGLTDGVTVSFLFLSLFDLGFLVMTFCGGVSTAFHVIERNHNLRFLIEPYGLFLIFGNASILISLTNTLTTTFLAVARCMCVARPLQFKNTFTRNRTIVFNMMFFISALVLYTPILCKMGMLPRTDKKTNFTRPSLWMSKDREAIKDVVLLTINTIFPFLTQAIIIICVFVMASSLRTASKFRQASTMTAESVASQRRNIDTSEKPEKSEATASDRLSGKDQRVVQQVFLISVVYIICNTIKIVISVVGVIEPQFRITGLYRNLYVNIHGQEKYFEIGNASVNTFIYYSYSTRFRKHLRDFMCIRVKSEN